MLAIAPRPTSKTSDMLSRLRADIVAGRLAPGQHLSTRLLQARYGATMSPLREALCQLAGAGLVELSSHKGFRVASVSHQDFEHIVAIRNHLEIYSLGLAVARGAPVWRRRLEQAAGQFDLVAAKIGDRRPIDQQWEDLHRQYHFALTDAAGSPVLLQLFEQLYDKFDRYRRIAVPIQAYMALPARDHHDITAAAVTGDVARASTLLQRHIDDIVDIVRIRLTETLAGGVRGAAPPDATTAAKSAARMPSGEALPPTVSGR